MSSFDSDGGRTRIHRRRAHTVWCSEQTSGLNAGFATAVLFFVAAMLGSCAGQQRSVDQPVLSDGAISLERDFANPPDDARPRVWWHWMNGNITEEGIREDLAWMKRSGIAGVQAFEVDIKTPQIVDKPLAFMTPGWKAALRVAASEADRLGLEMAIPTSPGFSVTGGPWVAPHDGMKKIAWSETIVEGGQPFRGRLTSPPQTTGPFQDAPPLSLLAPLWNDAPTPSLYQDTAVFAYRLPPASTPPAVRATLSGRLLDGAKLSDGSFDTGILVPKGSASEPTIIDLTLDKPQPVRAVTILMRGGFQMFQLGVVFPRLEASLDGKNWRKVADLGLNFVPATISFPPVEAKFFRLVLVNVATAGMNDRDAAPGAERSPFDIFKISPDVELVELRLSAESRIDRWEAKAGFASLPERYAPDAALDGREQGVALGDVIDLTAHMAADGVLNWTPPPGTWRVVRMGWSLIGTKNHPAPVEATGLEVDKLDRAAVRRYLETYLAKYKDAAGADLFGRRGVQALLTDSTEVGAFNWTPGLLEKFRDLRGYDPRPWLPALTGAIVGSRDDSDRFLFDFRRTVGELHATEHYGTIAAVAHEHGLKVYGEALEGSSGSLGDDLDMRRYADIPMGAQWTFARNGKPQPMHEADLRGAASVAHVYGKNIVAAEALTASSNPWAHAPADLRPAIDLIFASGVNRPVLHTSVHVPRDDMAPGLSLWIYGQYFNRLETWADMARPWVDYIARSSVLLQAGQPVADVAYFYGEERPIAAMSSAGLPADLPRRYAYDFVSASAVRHDLKVDKGAIVAPGGVRYRVLQLGGSSNELTLATLRRIAELAGQGATIVGEAPRGSPGLNEQTSEYASLVRKLWGGSEVTLVGQGRVVASRDVEKALDMIGVRPDFALVAPRADSHVLFVHRRIDDGEIYFVNNRSNEAQAGDIRFRVTGKAPEIWRADTGEIKPASYRMEGDVTVLPLDMSAEDSFFVVFRKDTNASERTVAPDTIRAIADVDGPWNVTFQAGRGAPASTTFATLASLSENTHPGIRYFSGVATYRTTFDAPASPAPGNALLIDLGAIGDVAEVRVNGKLAGAVWHPPYSVDIGQLIRPGRNELDIRVANLWVNRLIGDAQPGAAPITFTSTPTYKADAPLRPSGLIGPVRLLATGW